jgi:hypothetical protein
MIKTIFYVLLSLLVASSAECARRKAPESAQSSPPQRFATLRASRPSFLVGGRGGQREVRYLSVRVSNIGDVGATDVQVSIEGASGLSFPLRGPKRLSPHAAAVYVSTVRVPSSVALHPQVHLTCATCRR